MLKTISGAFIRGVADGYSLSRPHGDLRGRNFPAVRDSESADTVVIDLLRKVKPQIDEMQDFLKREKRV